MLTGDKRAPASRVLAAGTLIECVSRVCACGRGEAQEFCVKSVYEVGARIEDSNTRSKLDMQHVLRRFLRRG